MNDETPIDMNADEALAAEFALGVLGQTEMRAAELRLLRDPAFRAAVEAWQADLNPLAQQLMETPPTPELWERIAAEIDPVAKAKAAPKAKPTAKLASKSVAVKAVALAPIAKTPPKTK